MKHAKIPVLKTTDYIYPVKEGMTFFVEDGGKYTLYTLKDTTNITPTTTVQSAIDNKYVETIREGYVEPTLKVYQAGETFHSNELFTESTKTRFYVAEVDFVATGDFEADKNNGYFKAIGQSEYKQVETNLNASESLTIPLLNENYSYNKHCFVEINRPTQSNVVYTVDRFVDDTLWDYDHTWGIVNDKLGLKHEIKYDTNIFTNSQGIKISEKQIDINDYREIKQVTAIFGA